MNNKIKRGGYDMENEHFTQILRAINDVKDDMRDFKRDMIARWEKNDKKWEENQKQLNEIKERLNTVEQRMDSMEQRMDKMEQRMDSMEQKQENMSSRMDSDHKGIFDVFEKYEESVEKMYQENRKKILVLEKKLKIANM